MNTNTILQQIVQLALHPDKTEKNAPAQDTRKALLTVAALEPSVEAICSAVGTSSLNCGEVLCST